jgi:hypothetical protein
MNHHARALGKLNKGKKKTMTPAALLQRARASRKAAEVRSKKKIKKALTDIVSGARSRA